jgi:hypothetical protein
LCLDLAGDATRRSSTSTIIVISPLIFADSPDTNQSFVVSSSSLRLRHGGH